LPKVKSLKEVPKREKLSSKTIKEKKINKFIKTRAFEFEFKYK